MRLLRPFKRPKSRGFASIKNASGPPPIGACVAHRCVAHEKVKPLNFNTVEKTECGACIAADINGLMTLYQDAVDRLDRACNALDLMSLGAGQPFRLPVPDDEPENPNSSTPTTETP